MNGLKPCKECIVRKKDKDKTLGMTLIDVYSADRHERKKIKRQRQREIRNEGRGGRDKGREG